MAGLPAEDPPSNFFVEGLGLDHAEGASTGFMVASGGVISEDYGHGGPGRWPDGVLSEGYGHVEPGVCLGDGRTRRPLLQGVRRKVDAATAALAYVPIPDLT